MRTPARDRRLFLQYLATSTAMTATSLMGPSRWTFGQSPSTSPNEKLIVGVMGVNSRGADLAKGFARQPNVSVGAICDVDLRAAERTASHVTELQASQPEVFADFRRILDDKHIDVLVVAAPNHWHAPATILGCAAGKHVYVEKPCSHTAQEGELAVAAARKHQRVVQMGSQRRSWPVIQEAIGKIHAGALGDVLYARTWYNNRRPSIGTGTESSPPEWLDWNLWQGPAPERPFKDNLVHYHWHWHWHYGNGELGNNGIHGIDVARWGLQVDFPNRVTAGGGHYRFRDDQETPDTMMVTFDFPQGKSITWEGLSWSPLGPHDSRFGISFHGTEGSLVIRNADYAIYDANDREIMRQQGDGGDATHLANFLSAIRTGQLPNADIEQAHRSTLLCHLGNIAYRCREHLSIDPSTGHILNSANAQQFWQREYREGWEPKV